MVLVISALQHIGLWTFYPHLECVMQVLPIHPTDSKYDNHHIMGYLHVQEIHF
jgi:hypothetical protein